MFVKLLLPNMVGKQPITKVYQVESISVGVRPVEPAPEGANFSIEDVVILNEGEWTYDIEKGMEVYVMNNEGKTIDKFLF